MLEHSSDHKKLVLNDKLLSIKLQKNDTIPRYLRKFTKGCDELGRVGVNVLSINLSHSPSHTLSCQTLPKMSQSDKIYQ